MKRLLFVSIGIFSLVVSTNAATWLFIPDPAVPFIRDLISSTNAAQVRTKLQLDEWFDRNAVASINGVTKPAQLLSITNAGSVPRVMSSGSNHFIQLPYAATNRSGVLSSNDFNAFKSKSSALDASNVVSGTIALARLPSNAAGSPGIVPSPANQPNKVYGTDGSGNPGWLTSAEGPGGGSGETNTASNVGSGIGIFKQKFGTDLQFNSLLGAGGAVVVSNNSTLTILAASTNHTHSTAGITSGSLALTRGGTGGDLSGTGGAGQYVKQSTPGGAFSVGTIPAGDLPSHNHAAGDLSSGQVPLARGGTGANLSGTGGAGQVLKQSSLGGNVTVGPLVSSDIPGHEHDGSNFVSGTISSSRLPVNSIAGAGILPSPSGQTNKLWGTGADGIPAWIDPPLPSDLISLAAEVLTVTNLTPLRLIYVGEDGVLTNLTDGSSGQTLVTDGAGNYSWTNKQAPISGTLNRLSKFTSSGMVGDSALSDDGTYLSWTGRELAVSKNDMLRATWSSSSDTAGNRPSFVMTRSRGNISALTPVISGDWLGTLIFRGYVTNGLADAAYVLATVDGSLTSPTACPGKLEFFTSDGTSGPASRLAIKNDGKVGVGTTNPSTLCEINNGVLNLAHSGADGSVNEILRSQLFNNTGASTWRNSVSSAVSSSAGQGILRFSLANAPATQLDVLSLFNNGTVQVHGLAGTGTRLVTGSETGQLSAIANGTNGQILTMVAGAPAWATGGGSGTPGGSSTHVQFNKDNAFAGDDGLKYDDSTKTLTVSNLATRTFQILDGAGTNKVASMLVSNSFQQLNVTGSRLAAYDASGFLTNVPAGTDGYLLTASSSSPGGIAYVAPSSTNLHKKTYLYFGNPDAVDSVGCVFNTQYPSSELNKKAIFSGTGAAATNWCSYMFIVPMDLDTNSVMTLEKFKIVLLGLSGDTGAHRYVISMCNAPDGTTDQPGFSNALNLDFPGDPSGALADVESVSNITLTSWNTSLIPGDLMQIKVARDGSNDASTENACIAGLTLSYTSTQ